MYVEEVGRREEDRKEFQKVLEEREKINYKDFSSEKIKRGVLRPDLESQLRSLEETHRKELDKLMGEKEKEKECINELNQTIEDMYIQQKMINSEKKVN